MKTPILVLALLGIALASPIVKRDAPYPASLPHSTYGEPIAPPVKFIAPAEVKIEAPIQEIPELIQEYGPPATSFIAPSAPVLPELPKLPEEVIPHFPEAPKTIEAALPVVFDAPYPAAVEPASEYGPPPTIKESKPIVVEIPETPAEEYGPPQTSFIAPAAPALPELPKLPEEVIRHFPEAPKTIEAALPVVFDAPYPAAVEPSSEYGPPPTIKESKPIVVEIPETPAEEYGPPQTSFIAPAAPALPELPKLPEEVIRHFPEAPKTIEAALPVVFDAPYPAAVEPASEYGPPPTIKESKPIVVEIPETPAEEYGPPQTSFIAPAAPALPELPKLPEEVIRHFPEAPKTIEAALPVVFDAPYPAAVEPASEYGPPPTIKESRPIVVEEYVPPQTAFIAPAAPVLPDLPKLPELIIPHIPEEPKIIEASLPIVYDAPYPPPVPHEEYGPPTTTTTTTTLPPPTTTTLAPPTGPYPAAGPISHYGDPIQNSIPFFIRVNSKNKGFSFVEIGGQQVARNNKLLVDEGSFTYYDNNSNPIHVKYHTNN